ncbi:MAG: PAS domain S-box protein [Deltaproteobacteria bacterium]|nr:PAS domain S-box protein [Deltaproteobacteria bacterium]
MKNQGYQQEPLRARLLAMMVFRVVLALTFLGITTWFQIKDSSLAHPAYYPIYAIVVVISLLTIFYAKALSWTNNLRVFTYAQVVVDIALVTVIVYVSGGIESYLTILYFLSVMGSSLLLNRTGGLVAASLASAAYGVLVDLDFYGMLPVKYKVFWIPVTFEWQDVVTRASTNILAFFVVGYLTGYLAERTERVEKELHEKGVDLERLERLSRHIFEHITSGIMTLDAVMRITSFNRAAQAITGYPLRDVYYRNVNEIFPGLMTGSPLRGLDPVTAEPDIRLERMFTRPDGVEVFIGFTISKGYDGGSAAAGVMDFLYGGKAVASDFEAAAIVIFQDLTKLKNIEEQLRRADRLKALGELSVGIAHEVRNPLASISGSIQVLKEDLKLRDEDLRLMDIIIRETERLNALIADFLVFARPAREKMDRINLSDLVNETVKLFRNSAEVEGIEIISRVEGGIFVSGDARQIGQIFWNLLLNSAHAMGSSPLRGSNPFKGRKGRMTVSSSFRRGSLHAGRKDVEPSQRADAAASGDTFAEIQIEDTGCGIAPENIERIFDPFFSTKDSGTGLGLAIAHRVAQSHGGDIEVKSTAGKGAVFTVLLPLAPEKALAGD